MNTQSTSSQPNRLLNPLCGLTLSVVVALSTQPSASANDYVGSETCVTACHEPSHEAHYSELTTSIHSKMIRVDAHLPGVIHGDLRKPNAPRLPPTNDPTNDVHWVMGGWYKEESYIRTNWTGSNIAYTVTQFEWNPIKSTYASDKSLRDWLVKCAGCHTTGYEPATRTFRELNIGCEACHGPGGDHVANDGDKGLIVLDRSTEGCGYCHIRAENVAMGSFTNKQFNFPIGYVPGDPSSLHFIPEPLTATASFFPDGTANRHRETYLDMNYPGRASSKHYTQGVSCVKCHDPHTAGILANYTTGLPTNTYGIQIYDNVNLTTNYVAWASGNSLWHPTNHTAISKQDLCKVCHSGVSEHHVHQFNATALAASVTCVDCHMPDVINIDAATLRGALTPHRFTAMTPANSMRYGPNAQPNSCTYRCHQNTGADKTTRAQWADSILTLRAAPLVATSHPFQMRVVGTPDFRYALDFTTDFTTWTPLTTNMAAALPNFAPRWGFEADDPGSADAPHRFYRVRQVSPAP